MARFQLKSTSAEGALAAAGLGIRLDDMSLIAESYGSALGTINTGVSNGERDYNWIDNVRRST